MVLDTVPVPIKGNRGRDVTVESPKKPIVEPGDMDVGPVGSACVLDLDVRASEDSVQFPPGFGFPDEAPTAGPCLPER